MYFIRNRLLVCFLAGFVLSQRAVAQSTERYAALECQNETAFVVVNFYSDHSIRLTWGENDLVSQEDLLVTQTTHETQVIFSNSATFLSMPELPGIDSDKSRPGTFRVSRPTLRSWNDLRCKLFSAD